MDSDRTQPLVNNPYPNLPPQNQGWNGAPNGQVPPPNQGYNNQPINPNQGYNPNPNPTYNNYPPQNQGFNNNMPPPNYGGQQPMMPGQQPMPNINQDKIIIIQQHSSMPCAMCGFDGMSTWRQNAGCAAYGWCICLFLCFWPLCWLPFCMDSCYDTEIVCTRCGQVKHRLQADCC